MLDGKPAQASTLRDFTTDDVLMVEVYASGGVNGGSIGSGRTGLAPAAIPCGSAYRAVPDELGYLHYYARPDPGVVSAVYIWLKH